MFPVSYRFAARDLRRLTKAMPINPNPSRPMLAGSGVDNAMLSIPASSVDVNVTLVRS
jgi:hypothetical protein